MKAIIFAGGIGTRLWPLSRQDTPKQFEDIIGSHSTLQLGIKRLKPDFDEADIFISTGQRYLDTLKQQAPNIPSENFITEPEMRDVAAAIGLAMVHMEKLGHADEPVAILWSDHVMSKPDNFRAVLKFADQYIRKNPDKFLFIGHVPRFASDNLGWIEIGKQLDQQQNFSLHTFKSFRYRPPKEIAESYFKDGQHVWNVGYFIVTPRLVLNYYKKLAPDFYRRLTLIQQAIGTPNYDKVLSQQYSQLEKTSFDNLVLEKIDPKKAVVIKVELGWADIGTWEALWDIIDKDKDNNLTKGQTITSNAKNCLIYNYDSDKLIVGVNLDNLVIVNTKDVILICPKGSDGQVKRLVKKLQKDKRYAKHT
ncbi:MAG: hypothetical protein GXP43_02425 [bacterium]|nr:hypothetical protein [bacterium]